MRGEVDPQLEAVDISALTTARHFFVQDPASGRHPLHIARTDEARIAETVTMTRGAVEHVGDGFDAAMWVVGEAADGSFDGIVESKVVKQQERIEQVANTRRDGATQLDARALDGVLWFDNLKDFSWVVHIV